MVKDILKGMVIGIANIIPDFFGRHFLIRPATGYLQAGIDNSIFEEDNFHASHALTNIPPTVCVKVIAH